MKIAKLKSLIVLGLACCSFSSVANEADRPTIRLPGLERAFASQFRPLGLNPVNDNSHLENFDKPIDMADYLGSTRGRENLRRILNGQKPIGEGEYVTPSWEIYDTSSIGSTGFKANLDFSNDPYRLDSLWNTGTGISQFQGTSISIDNVNSTTGDTFHWNDQQCTDVSPDSLSKAADDLNWGKCFENRLSYAINTDTSQKELLQNDMNICECLRNFPTVPAVGEIMRGNVAEDRSKSVPKAELDDIMNGVFLQSYEVLQDVDLATKYAHNLYDKNKMELTLNPKLLRDEGPFDTNVCISPREFILQNQKPSPGIRDLFNGEFKPSEWDYKNLQAQYVKLMELSISERKDKEQEIVFLKEKLKYLNRNPLLKYALGAVPEPGKIQPGLKENVFNAMKIQKDPECAVITSECSKNYQAALAGIFKNPDVLTLVRKEAMADHKERSTRKQKGSVLSERKKDLTQKNIINEFMETYRLKSPDTCESNKVNGIGCLEIYSGYCKTVDKYKNEIHGLSTEPVNAEIYNDLDEDLRDDFNVDFATNEEYQRMNADACETQNGRKARLPFLKANGPAAANFDQFVKTYCAEPKDHCPKNGKIATYKDMIELRQKWIDAYPPGEAVFGVANRNGLARSATRNALFSHAHNGHEVGQATAAETNKLAQNDHNAKKDESKLADDFTKVVASRGDSLLGGRKGVMGPEKVEKPFMADFGQAVANTMNQTGFSDIPSYDEAPSYTNNFIAPQISETPVVAEAPKIENMSDDKRQDLLEDWQKEYEDWKKSKGNEMTPADVAKDTALRQEIATLRTLLAQQQQMSEQQFKLLNDALVSKSRTVEQQKPEERSQEVKKAQSQFASAARSIASDDESETLRQPASVKETKFNTAGANGGISSPSISSRKNSSGDSSSDSVAREEAKLVNMRRHNDGSITIESTGANNAAAANAITVPVSDEQYRILQTNPAGLNLSQIERNIPKDQIEKLEKSGEIIILLRNGSNPPFEVKVAKKDNRLVYSLKDKNGNDQAPVRRVYTRQALQLELKAER